MKMPVNKDFLANLKVGDTVTRMLAGTIPMNLIVTAMDADTITCGWWTFNRATGGEVDYDLGWDGVEATGSVLTPFRNDDTITK